MNKPVWRNALLTDVIMSFGICFGIVVPVLIVLGTYTLSDLMVPALVISSFYFIVGLPLYLHVFKSNWERKTRE